VSLKDRKGVCPTCGHEWDRHDPDDGTCDAPRADGGFGVCPCGRNQDSTALDLLKAAKELRAAFLDGCGEVTRGPKRKRLLEAGAALDAAIAKAEAGGAK
jgi:hypothetical protein